MAQPKFRQWRADADKGAQESTPIVVNCGLPFGTQASNLSQGPREAAFRRDIGQFRRAPVWRGSCSPSTMLRNLLLVTGLVLVGCSSSPVSNQEPTPTQAVPCTENSECGANGFCSAESVCATPQCGDGAVEPGEACDDGNGDDNDACTTTCENATCGDGYVWAGQEACDDGNQVDGDGCETDCTATIFPAVCGDGVIEGAEICDDGNMSNNDACLSNCEPASCGDGEVWAGEEECDLGNGNGNNGPCLEGCITATCGDGFRHNGVEQCDDGNQIDNDACGNDCTLPSCGNGELEQGEQCDDNNNINGDGCDNNCTPTGCGNGITTGTEQCDDGNQTNTDACLNSCVNATCGDNVIWNGVEDCEDLNLVNGDGCDNNCTFTGCGNEIVDPTEECELNQNATLATTNQVCNASDCTYGCLPNYGDCNNDIPTDGCEVDLLTASAHCNQCGYTCDGSTCTDGLCDPLELAATGQFTWSIAVDATDVFYANLDGIHSVPKDASATPTTVLALPNTDFPGMKIEGNDLYYVIKLSESCTTSAQCTGGGFCSSNGTCRNNNQLRRINKDGTGTPFTVYDGFDNLDFEIDAANARVFLAERTGTSAMKVAPINGAGPVVTIESYVAPFIIERPKIFNDHVYWQTRGAGDRNIHRIPLNFATGAAAIVATNVGSSSGVFDFDVGPGFVGYVTGNDLLATLQNGIGGSFTVAPGNFDVVRYAGSRVVALTSQSNFVEVIPGTPTGTTELLFDSFGLVQSVIADTDGFVYFSEGVTAFTRRVVKLRLKAR